MGHWYDPFGVTDPFTQDPSKLFEQAGQQFKQYADLSREYQKPFYEAGKNAIPQYQNYLNKMSDPSKFINDLMKGYSTSPQEQYTQDQAMRASTNMASATGLTGSTPFQLQAQENAGNIANEYQEQWLKDLLGINSQYGSGLSNLMSQGQGSANSISSILNSLGTNMGEMAYSGGMAKQQQMSQLLGLILRGGLGMMSGGATAGGGAGGAGIAGLFK